jgi:hypothetical protein
MTDGQQPKIHDRFESLRTTRSLAVKLIATAVGLTFFVSEVKKLLNSSPGLLDYLYLALLACLGVKVATWILISERELKFISQWLDPKDYEPPTETATILALAVTLTALILTARNLVLFGICYVLYSVGNLYGWWRLQHELQIAIPKTLNRLKDEKPGIAEIRRKALEAMTAYYLKPPHVLRSAITLIAALVTLSVAGFARLRHSQPATVAAYILCIFDLLFVEEAWVGYWRVKFYSAMRPIYAAEYELERQSQEQV